MQAKTAKLLPFLYLFIYLFLYSYHVISRVPHRISRDFKGAGISCFLKVFLKNNILKKIIFNINKLK
jgi:hypothetical protein